MEISDDVAETGPDKPSEDKAKVRIPKVLESIDEMGRKMVRTRRGECWRVVDENFIPIE